ncbi:hypothetical protein DPEC_G00361270 [Dallia pectoralis]|uniref:Uncharacterized protein n=1 Tax=Dallia pectoralis TaxID=75939 RepID=A0ACC2F1G0_DALPE|nr:hypothetical protein DPEC_G00361270 [Dallia pectoralis]
MTDTGPWRRVTDGEDTDFSLAVCPSPSTDLDNLTCTCPMMSAGLVTRARAGAPRTWGLAQLHAADKHRFAASQRASARRGAAAGSALRVELREKHFTLGRSQVGPRGPAETRTSRRAPPRGANRAPSQPSLALRGGGGAQSLPVFGREHPAIVARNRAFRDRLSPVPKSADRDVSAGELRPTPDRSDPLPAVGRGCPVVKRRCPRSRDRVPTEDRTGSPRRRKSSSGEPGSRGPATARSFDHDLRSDETTR